MELLKIIKKLLSNKEIAGQDVSIVTETILAETIAITLELPASPVADVQGYFNVNNKAQLLKTANTVNELTIVDIDRLIDTTFKLWLFRYKLVHATNDSREGRLATLIALNNTNYLPKETTETLSKYPDIYLTRWNIKDMQERK